jgi:nicotinate-nucleotide adenylyltransferase
MRIGICGGTFDPFHRGHLQPVLSIRETMQWQRVVYVPARVQPFKAERRSESAFHRHAMMVLATEAHDEVEISVMELERPTLSYTVDTLEELRRRNPEVSLEWVIGEDNVNDLDRWKSIDTILALANFVVLSRPRASNVASLPETLKDRVCEPGVRPSHGAIVFVPNETVQVSSTEIRQRVAERESIDELVDPRVARYIHHYGLYRKDQRD